METPIQILITFGIGLISGFVGSITGTGGVISIPFLISLGLPPSVAISTERFSAIFPNIIIIRDFLVNKKIIRKYFLGFTLTMLIGVIVNTYFIISLNDKILKIIIISLMLISLIFILKYPKVGLVEKKTSKKFKIFGYSSLLITNIFSGFIGGLGIIKYILISIFFGTTYIKANASLRLPWFISITITSIFLFFKGYIIITIGISLAVGSILGSHIGVMTEIKKGDKWVRGFFIFIILFLIGKYLFF